MLLHIHPVQRCVDNLSGVAMSYVVAVPEFVASAASDLSNISSGLTAAHALAAAPTTAVVAAAGDGLGGNRVPVLRARPGLSGAQRRGLGVSFAVRRGLEW